MPTTLNREAYQKLIDEDIAWLERQPRSLERDHVIDVLRASVEHEYPTRTAEDQHGSGRGWDRDIA